MEENILSEFLRLLADSPLLFVTAVLAVLVFVLMRTTRRQGEEASNQIAASVEMNRHIVESFTETLKNITDPLVDTIAAQQQALGGFTEIMSGVLTEIQDQRLVSERNQASILRRMYSIQETILSMTPDLPNMAIGMIAWGADGRVLEVNEHAPHILSYTRAEIMKWNIFEREWDCYDAEGNSIEKLALPVVKSLKEGTNVRGGLLGVQSPRQPSRVWLSISVMPVTNDATVVGAVSSFVDITEMLNALSVNNLSKLTNGLAAAYNIGE